MYIDSQQLPEGQTDYVRALITDIDQRLRLLTKPERAIFAAIWPVLSRTAAPVVLRNMNVSFPPLTLQLILDKLIANRLVWFDNDLQAVLQCAPFSALHTPHQIKAFGWERAFACSMVDAPLSLILYGPNTWLKVNTQCPRSGEILEFRVMQADDGRLKLDSRDQHRSWRVWIPYDSEDGMQVGPLSHRDQMRAFNSQEDLETYLQYHPDMRGTIYTLPQALYLAQCLLDVYRHVFDEPPPTRI